MYRPQNGISGVAPDQAPDAATGGRGALLGGGDGDARAAGEGAAVLQATARRAPHGQGSPARRAGVHAEPQPGLLLEVTNHAET